MILRLPTYNLLWMVLRGFEGYKLYLLHIQMYRSRSYARQNVLQFVVHVTMLNAN